jgi:hypothetical protein
MQPATPVTSRATNAMFQDILERGNVEQVKNMVYKSAFMQQAFEVQTIKGMKQRGRELLVITVECCKPFADACSECTFTDAWCKALFKEKDQQAWFLFHMECVKHLLEMLLVKNKRERERFAFFNHNYDFPFASNQLEDNLLRLLDLHLKNLASVNFQYTVLGCKTSKKDPEVLVARVPVIFFEDPRVIENPPNCMENPSVTIHTSNRNPSVQEEGTSPNPPERKEKDNKAATGFNQFVSVSTVQIFPFVAVVQ